MQRYSFADMNCSVAQALEQIGEWWTLLILRDALLGVTRFEEFQSRLGISRNILSTRLDKLVEDGILERRQYSDRPVRHDYVLTPKGRDLWKTVVVLREWGDRWITGRGDEPVVMVHDACDHKCIAELHCSHCGERLRARDIHLEQGPGLRDPDLIPPATTGSRRRR